MAAKKKAAKKKAAKKKTTKKKASSQKVQSIKFRLVVKSEHSLEGTKDKVFAIGLERGTKTIPLGDFLGKTASVAKQKAARLVKSELG